MDYPKALVAHLIDKESLRIIHEQNLIPKHVPDPVISGMLSFCKEYWVMSGFDLAPTEEVLRAEYQEWFATREMPVVEVDIRYIIDGLKDRYAVARSQSELTDIGVGVINAESPAIALREGIAKISSILMDLSTSRREEVYPEGYSERLNTYFERQIAVAAGLRVSGTSFFSQVIDDEIRGLKPEELAILVAATGMGKSWTMCKTALFAAMNGHKVYFVSMENNPDDTRARLDCLMSGVPYGAVDSGNITVGQARQLKQARDAVESLGDNLILDQPLTRDERTVHELYVRARYRGADLFVGDQLSHLTPVGRYDGNRTLEYEEHVANIVDLTREYGMASVWAAQFNRQGAKVVGGRGKLHDIGISSFVEHSADWVFSLWATQDMKDSDKKVLEILKARRYFTKAWLVD